MWVPISEKVFDDWKCKDAYTQALKQILPPTLSTERTPMPTPLAEALRQRDHFFHRAEKAEAELEKWMQGSQRLGEKNAKLREACQLATDWINGTHFDGWGGGEEGTTTLRDEDIAAAHAQGDAIKQALLDALQL
jgi:hypothetical protein